MILTFSENKSYLLYTAFTPFKIYNLKFDIKDKLSLPRELSRMLDIYKYNYRIYKNLIEKYNIKLAIINYDSDNKNFYKMSIYQQMAIFNEMFDIDHIWYSIYTLRANILGHKDVTLNKIINYLVNIDKDFAGLDEENKRLYIDNFLSLVYFKKHNPDYFQKLKSLSLKSSIDK